MVPVSLPSYVSSIVVVFAPDIYTNPRAFYFVETPSGWKLAFVDDTLFSA